MARLICPIGQKFGNITILEDKSIRGKVSQWLGVCDCGTTKIFLADNLRSGKSKSCGCVSSKNTIERNKAGFLDLTGKVFGKLTVIQLSSEKSLHATWLCSCECGTIRDFLGDNLRAGKARSCGCLKKETDEFRKKNSREVGLLNYSVDLETGCWEFRGYRNRDGYGKISKLSMHRYAYETATGNKIKPGNVVMHSCDNPSCINPAHLKEGSVQENIDDRTRKDRGYVNSGPDSHFASMDEDTVKMLRSLSEEAALTLGKNLGFSQQAIANMLAFRTYKNVEN